MALVRVGVVDVKAISLTPEVDDIDSQYDATCTEIILNRNADLESRVPVYLDTCRNVVVIGTPKYEMV